MTDSDSAPNPSPTPKGKPTKPTKPTNIVHLTPLSGADLTIKLLELEDYSTTLETDLENAYVENSKLRAELKDARQSFISYRENVKDYREAVKDTSELSNSLLNILRSQVATLENTLSELRENKKTN